MVQVVVFFLFVQTLIRSGFAQQDSYKAAVLEYSPLLTGLTTADHVRDNTREYINYLGLAARQGAKIIVFPENGLTGWGVDVKDLKEASTNLPDPSENISPCINRQHGNYSQFLVDLSCAVRKNQIYAVINLIEWHHDHQKNNKKVYHSTNVVFDKSGSIFARYRKINLLDEPHYNAGPRTVSTFSTDFEVTFGMFISHDILFQSPAQDVLLDPAVTNIVYSAAWPSELPFFEANSVQHGYAKSNGVNLLAAGLNNPAERNGGSGIYLADGRITENYLSGYKTSRLLIQEVPKLKSKLDILDSCQGGSNAPRPPSADIIFFRTAESDLSLYTFKAVDLSKYGISETVCSKGSKFCCSFDLIIRRHPGMLPNYAYKLIAFYGVTKLSKTKTIGLHVCGLVACLNETESSCGGRHHYPPVGVTFDSLIVKGNFSSKNSHQRPSTVNFDLMPATDYMFCKTKKPKDQVEVKVTITRPRDTLLTFGILGRVFEHDDKPTGLISGAKFAIFNLYWIAISLSVIIFIQQD